MPHEQRDPLAGTPLPPLANALGYLDGYGLGVRLIKD
jgi:hypothetical protein